MSEASFHQADAARAVDTGVLVSIIVEFDVLVCVRDDLGVDPKTLSSARTVCAARSGKWMSVVMFLPTPFNEEPRP